MSSDELHQRLSLMASLSEKKSQLLKEAAAAYDDALTELRESLRVRQEENILQEARREGKLVRQEQRDRKVLRIWADLPPITRLSREKIARLLGLQVDNGWLGKHLTSMVKRGVLANDLKKTGVGGFYPPTPD